MRTLVAGTDISYPIFYAIFDRIVPAANKFMATLFNSGTFAPDGIVEITRIYCFNWDNTYPVSSVILHQDLRFISARTTGVIIDDRRVDAGALPSDFSFVIADTNSTGVTFISNSFIRRLVAYQGNPIPEHNYTNRALIYERNIGDSGLICRANRGVTIQNITNPGANPGTCSYVFEWTVSTDKTSF